MGCRHSSGFVCAYHPAAPGSGPKHAILLKRTKIKTKKRLGMAHLNG